ncbi:MAG: T9SS type A sorting domain-containing protein [Flavobacteriaceae bacterium]|nr:T9SS type A sorting domain-containing protein [Flavobacteriaceae bacterium]
MKKKLLILFVLATTQSFAQNYTSYFTGDTADVTTNHQQGTCLMGGATENDNAMIWFLNKADGGDVVVLRASGADGYNDYFYSELGITINSVETLVINNASGALDPYVLQQVENAEAIWFAGGDQFDYITYFKDNAMEDALNEFINVKKGVIGGTSAGMAILGGHYFDAENGTVTSEQALTNPYDSRVSLGHSDFLQIPYLENVITDTHFDNPWRTGRLLAFMARIIVDRNVRATGLACEEFTSICIEADGKARVFGSYPAFGDFVYFAQPECFDYNPDTCEPGEELVWFDGLQVLKVPATESGDITIHLDTWEVITSEGEWEHWIKFDSGPFLVVKVPGENPDCIVLETPDFSSEDIKAYPSPFSTGFEISNAQGNKVEVFDLFGKMLLEINSYDGNRLGVVTWANGIYFVKISEGQKTTTIKVIKN